jgi:spore maturation protein CgeB
MGYEIWLETFDLIRSGSNAAIINWATDDSWKYEQFSRFVAPAFDAFATTYSSAMKKAEVDGHGNFILTQWAANSAVMAEPLPASECCYDVTFIGSAYGNRKQWIKELKGRFIEVKCFGYGWPDGPIDAEEIPRLIRSSKLCLNLADSGLMLDGGMPTRSRQIKARVFEVPGAGGLLVTEPADQLEDYYRPDEVVLFDSINDLVEKIRYLLTNPNERDIIAKAGFHRTQQEHNYEERFRPLLEYAVNRRQVRMKAEAEIDFLNFDKVANLHCIGLTLRIMRSLLLLPCILIWGKQRGPRAARRFLFELSWRIIGRRTYSASSWTGRLFYKES